MTRARYDQAPRPNVVVCLTPNGYEFFPIGGQVNPDGSTAAVDVYGGGDSVSSSFTSDQIAITAAAPAVLISNLAPLTTQFSIWVQNVGGYPVWIGPAGVTNLTGFYLAPGNDKAFPIGQYADLYAYNETGGTTITVMVFS